MRILCCLVAAVFAGLCSGEGYWDIQLSPNSITSVPFGAGHISVWEHAHTRGRYYAMPLVHLLYANADTLENIVTGITELNFGVLMWSLEARESVYRHLKTHVNSTIVQEQVELLPMEKIRIVWRDRVRPLSRHFKLADQWRSNTHLPSIVTFQFVCADNEKCGQLKNAMRTTPAMFNALEMEYIINGQRSARRSMTIGSTHFIRGNLYTQLKNMPVSSSQRYLSSDDVNRLTSETVSNVIASVVTDADYVDTGDEVSMSDILQHELQRQQVSTASFEPQMWESVFWDPSFARPDKLTAYLNKVLSKDANDSRNFLLDESQRSWSVERGGGGSFMGVSVHSNIGVSSSRQSKVQKEDVLNTLKERHNHIEWTGEQFRVKPMKLYRLNLSTLNTSANIATANIQVRRYETVQGIKLRVSEEPQTPSLTPQLVEQRLTAKLATQTSEFDDKMRTSVTSLEALVDQRTARTERKISESTQGWRGRFNTLEEMTNAWPEYCERNNVNCPSRDLRDYHTPDVSRCRELCTATCDCVAIVHRYNDCTLKNERCIVSHLRPRANYKYLVKVSRAPVTMGMLKWVLTDTKTDVCSDPCSML